MINMALTSCVWNNSLLLLLTLHHYFSLNIRVRKGLEQGQGSGQGQCQVRVSTEQSLVKVLLIRLSCRHFYTGPISRSTYISTDSAPTHKLS